MKQGEIWLVDLEPTIGAELKKIRPAVIVNNNSLGRLPLKVIVPITAWNERYKIAPWMVNINPTIENGLDKESSIDCFQVRSISEERLVKRIGFVTKSDLAKIVIAINRVIE